MKAPLRLGCVLEAQEPFADCVDMMERLDGMNSAGESEKMKIDQMCRMGSALLERVRPLRGVMGFHREEAPASQAQWEFWRDPSS